MAPMARRPVPAFSSPLRKREQAVLTNQGVQVIDQRIQSGFSDSSFMLLFLVWWRSVLASFTDDDRQACIKTGLIPQATCRGSPLFIRRMSVGIRQLQWWNRPDVIT